MPPRAQQQAASHRHAQLASLEDIAGVLMAVNESTLRVHREVERLAYETAKAQRLAVWVGVGTAVLGSILGGLAGAVAARMIGS